jgi:hypothetical protein
MANVAEDFQRFGFAYVRGVLSPSSIKLFEEQLELELTQPAPEGWGGGGGVANKEEEPAVAPDRPAKVARIDVASSVGTDSSGAGKRMGPTWAEDRSSPAVSLRDCSTWPRKGTRRVVECAPLSEGGQWAELLNSDRLATALDTLLGVGAWELNGNSATAPGPGPSEKVGTGHAAETSVRHWYCPVVFPERGPEQSMPKQKSTSNTPSYDFANERGDTRRTAEFTTATLPAVTHALAASGAAAEAAAVRGSGGAAFRSGSSNVGGGGAVERQYRTMRLCSWKEEVKANGKRCVTSCLHPPPFSHGRVRTRFQLKTCHFHVCLGLVLNRATCDLRPTDRELIFELAWGMRRAHHNTGNLKEEEGWWRWQPVNRRRVCGKGWHIDIGPGFDLQWARTLRGHPYQGLVMIVLLSDWEPGAGGTVSRPWNWRCSY